MFKVEAIESEYISKTSIEHRKKYAQFFTPYILAEVMTEWLVGNKDLHVVLEPAFGLGVFTRVLRKKIDNIQVKGFEVDDKIFAEAKGLFGDDVNLQHQDYMYNDWENKYDGIICNPPYFKFHDYDNKPIIREMETRLSCKLNGFTNLYTLFLLKSIHQLKPGGRCAYIIPSEFLNSDYGTLVKLHLLKTKTLRHVIVFNSSECLFEDALTTSCIVLCENSECSAPVDFVSVESFDDPKTIVGLFNGETCPGVIKNEYALSELDPDVKWKTYYQKSRTKKYRNLVPFSSYAKVMRGIATGANDFFMFSKSKAEKFGIGERYLRPCICRCTDVKGSVFTSSDFQRLKSEDKNVFILDAVGADDKNVQDYLAMGVEEGIDERYLTSSRKPWFSLENRPPAPIWVSVFNRTGLRFVRNLAGVSNLTTFHCVYPQSSLYQQISGDLLYAYLQTNVAKEIFQENCREYGSGLQKFEPNDLNKGLMLDLSLLPAEEKKKIEDMVKNSKGSLQIEEIESILLDYFF